MTILGLAIGAMQTNHAWSSPFGVWAVPVFPMTSSPGISAFFPVPSVTTPRNRLRTREADAGESGALRTLAGILSERRGAQSLPSLAMAAPMRAI